MTKQDFELIARVLRAERQSHDGFPAQVAAIDNVTKAFADVLRTGNVRFDRARFIAACVGEDSTDSAGRKVRYSA